MSLISEVLASKIFWVMFVSILLTQLIKVLTHRFRFRTWSIDAFFQTGGMPSSHTASTVALTTALAFETGASPLFFAAALFTMIIIRDSYGVRKSVSDQAKILNSVTSEMKIHKKARIVLGHTPFQVFVGFIIGLFVAIAIYSL